MHRRSFIKNTGLTAGLLVISTKNILAGLLQQTGYTIQNLRGNVSIFSEKGGTIAFYESKDGFTVIDAQFPDTAIHLIKELKKLHDLPIKFLINTHHHFDHTSGNISFKDLAEHVVGHQNCLANYQRVSEQNKSVDKQLYQDITFVDTWKQKVGKEKIRTYYFGPGHTNGDAIIHFEQANIAHLGDLLFNRMHPYIDKSAGASISNWIQVLQKTRTTFDKDTQFIFGHATDPAKVIGNKEDLVDFEEYLQKLLDFVSKEIKAGKSKEEILKNKELPGLTWKASGVERGLIAAYEELTSK